MNLLQVKNVLPKLFESGQSVELRSGPGLGKSSIVAQVAKIIEQDMFGEEAGTRWETTVGLKTMMLSTFDPPDVAGYMVPQKTKDGVLVAEFTRPSWMPVPEIDGKYGVLFLDEFSQADNDTKKTTASLILDGIIGDYKLPPGWRVWLASNRMGDKSGTTRDLAFLNNRRMLIEVDADVKSWEIWAEVNAVHPTTIAFAKKHVATVFQDSVPDADGPFCTPRSLVLMTNDLLAMSDDGATIPHGSVYSEIAAGWIGKGAAAQYMSFASLAHDLPDIEDIIANPDSCLFPDSSPAQFLVCQILSSVWTLETCKPFLVYLERFGKDLQVMCVKSVLRRDLLQLKSADLKEWAKKHEKFMVDVHS